MRKFFLFLSFIILVYFSFGFYFATFDISIFNTKMMGQEHEIFHDYNGVSHVVTSYSKGSLAPPKILLEAAQADLSFLFFTDLNLLDRPYKIFGYQGNVFTFSNQKISYLDSHLLIYSQDPDFYFNSLSDANARLHQHFSEPPHASKDFLAVLAHPFKKHHKWTGAYPVGLDGIEVINLRHVWQDVWFKEKASFIWSIFTYPFNPKISLLRLIKEPKRELELWDQLNQNSKTLGFMGNETTAKIFKFLGLNFTFPSYAKSFQFASNHILLEGELTGHVQSDRKKIFNALRGGHFYFAFDSLGSPKGFAAYIKQNGARHLMGTKVSLSPGATLQVDLPKGLNVPFTVDIIKDGQVFFSSNKVKTIATIESPGVYRVEVKIQPLLPLPDREKWFGWIYSNPFYVTE